MSFEVSPSQRQLSNVRNDRVNVVYQDGLRKDNIKYKNSSK
jgi:hypothetical protein